MWLFGNPLDTYMGYPRLVLKASQQLMQMALIFSPKHMAGDLVLVSMAIYYIIRCFSS